jgi:hypothetical protein
MPLESNVKSARSVLLLAMQSKSNATVAAIPQPRGCEERYPSVLLDLGVDEKAGEIRMRF